MTTFRTRSLHNVAAVAEAFAAYPPEIPGWEHLCVGERVDSETVRYSLEDDEGASVWITVTVTDVELDESRVKPDPPEREKGDTDQ
jgi:hypothetical protein